MFSSDRNIETINHLIGEVKQYVELKGRCIQIDIVRKMTVLVSILIVGAILFALLAIIVLFLSFTLAAALAPYVGGDAGGYAIIVLLYILLAGLVILMRKKWIEAPLANLLGHLFLDKGAAEEGKTTDATETDSDENDN